MYNGNDGLSSTSKNDPSNLATRNKENYLNPISYLMQIKPQLTQVLLKINFCIICDWEMDLGHLAGFFEFVLASGPQPPGCRPETSTNPKKSAKWPRSISQSQMIQKFIFSIISIL